MKRALRNLIRFVAAGLLVFGGLEIGLELARRRVPNAEVQWWHYVAGAALIFLGGLLAAFSSKLAAHFIDDDEEP
jgi:cytochrome c biogenesis protein CcdA